MIHDERWKNKSRWKVTEKEPAKDNEGELHGFKNKDLEWRCLRIHVVLVAEIKPFFTGLSSDHQESVGQAHTC